MAMVAKRKPRGASTARGKGATMTAEAEDLMTTTFRIRREQWDALRTEATRRALESERGDRRPDASRLVREAIDEWLAKKR
jgi:hypothetical protein